MAEQLFAIVFRGRLQAGAEPAEVRANFAKLFNIDAARVEQMFSGQAVIIKKGLDLLAADKYKAALAKAGAVVEAIELAAAGAASAALAPAPAPVTKAGSKAVATPVATPAPPVSPAAAPAAAAISALESRTTDPTLARSAPPAALRGTPNALDTTIAEPGAVLVEATHVAAPNIATEHLSMSEPGVRIVDYTPPPVPEYDLTELSLAEPGVILVAPHKTTAAQFDLSALSLDESARS